VKKTEILGTITGGTYPYTHLREETYRRGNYQTVERTLRALFRSLGYGIERFFYYDARLAGYAYQKADTQPTIFDYDDSLRPDGAALIWAREILPSPRAIGRLVNSSATYLEGYLFQQAQTSVIVCWTQDRSTRLATVSNSAFSVADAMGNVLHTNAAKVTVNRRPQYWMSSTLTPEQMSTIFSEAILSGPLDSVAPALSIDESPHGAIVSRRHLPLRFRWTAVDDTYVNTDAYPANVVTRWKISGHNDWSDWSAERFLVLQALPPGEYRLNVQGKDADSNQSEILQGPLFQIGPPPHAPGNLQVR
jgi:hypothetical protein